MDPQLYRLLFLLQALPAGRHLRPGRARSTTCCPSRTKAVSQASFEADHPSGWSRSPLRDPRPSRHAIVNQPSHATGTRPVKVATLGIVAARHAVSPVPWLPLRGPLTGLTPALASGKSRPSCALRRLFRRHHLRRQRPPCGKPSTTSPGISKDRPSAGSTVEESTPANDIAAERFGMTGTTASSVFRLRGSSPP